MNYHQIDALMAQCQHQQARIKELEAEVERLKSPQPCGHPVADIVIGEEWAPGEFNHYCGRCAEIDAAVQAERERCMGIVKGWCYCTSYYTDRGLVAPNCDAHYIIEEIRQRGTTND